MKLLLFLALVLAGCAAVDESSPFPTSKTNLTLSEIRSLPPGTTFKDIEKRLRYYTGCEVAIPLISFEIEGEKEKNCMMLFEDKTERLLYAWFSERTNTASDDAIALWPKDIAGRKATEILAELGKNRGEPATTGNAGKEPLPSAEPKARRP